MTKQRPCKKIPSLNLELWNEFFAKNIPKTPKIELRQAPTAIFAAAILVNITLMLPLSPHHHCHYRC
jgi:hypothetical protein